MFRRPASERNEIKDGVTNALPAKFCTLKKCPVALLTIFHLHEFTKAYFLLGDVKFGFRNGFTDESSAA
jgi:hypothetical protein